MAYDISVVGQVICRERGNGGIRRCMNGKMTVLDRQDMGLRIHAGSVTRIDDPDLASRAVHEEIEIKYFYEGGATILIGSDSVSSIPMRSILPWISVPGRAATICLWWGWISSGRPVSGLWIFGIC